MDATTLSPKLSHRRARLLDDVLGQMLELVVASVEGMRSYLRRPASP